jgi:hypothetical protein
LFDASKFFAKRGTKLRNIEKNNEKLRHFDVRIRLFGKASSNQYRPGKTVTAASEKKLTERQF